ncbi:Re/Si-specific NAD(P)(+) transhydrogenase subunit alpha [Bathymodiolus septemdierum thioautotrophic gill symbiont]|uniref:NAD(P) transhydrogenase subunit alpha n=1 Tax=endosymbiont of Bathymodiolus septemdierum str. Myojin knoll TaxID=1303921 RepID=A0A0P0UQ16_9GAMM|nr:Re/Si-specific NAD(P)(+) transhydrogenase subunit alpha [Bathymodiolus septemdierum thioautotrophic gill symbiont]BAS67256.1 NAD(P) transhydrogenase subunit alpha [endosymbiont of Bathymodiolus septemdierum str. Myojin knoll]
MKIAIPKERYPGEQRVAVTPSVVSQLIDLGFNVSIETNAGISASFDDMAYQSAGAVITDDIKLLFAGADIILKVRAPELETDNDSDEISLMEPGTTLICFIWPIQNPALLQRLADQKVNTLAMDTIPRISRAQKMDALSSMANIAGYRAVIEAANIFGKFFTGQITAAGRIAPAKVLVIGAGVAGLSAIGTAKSLGAVVRGFDTRLEVKEQILSLNAEFLELDFAEDASGEGGYAKTMSKAFIDAEMALFTEQAKEVDIIITTALIPGKAAPILITAAMVKSMKAGSVIVDLAAEQGGNCELTKAHAISVEHGVSIIGYCDLPSRLAPQSSQLYAANIAHLLTELTPKKDGQIALNMEDEVIRCATVVHDGEIVWQLPAAAPVKVAAKEEVAKMVAPPSVDVTQSTSNKSLKNIVLLLIMGGLLWGVGVFAPTAFMNHLTVFVLACFIGYMVIWNVSHSLHTPLMSITNAISSIIILGALLQVSSSSNTVMWLSGIAVLITTINIVAGFAVTHRMLKMFNK